MKTTTRLMFMTLMILGLFFGFAGQFFPQVETFNFERLHVFLFNLCTGGTVILYFSEGQNILTPKARLFLGIAFFYAVCAFFNLYLPAILCAFSLCTILETARIHRFSWFPWIFFDHSAPVKEKFHHASLLCLSIGLFLSGVVMINTVYFPVVVIPKLTLDVFFLGFSFPVSLITMSVMFSRMADDTSLRDKVFKEISFWTVNLGVITFFVFILFEQMFPQIAVTLILTGSVILMFTLFIRLGRREQQKNFLLSGMVFLLATAVTGIAYIFLAFSPTYDPAGIRWLLKLHAFVSLYGWNLSGLAVIMRFDNFPIRLNSYLVIGIHWITVVVLAPLGTGFPLFSILTILCYAVIVYVILFTRGVEKA